MTLIPVRFIALNAAAELLELFSKKKERIVDGVFADRLSFSAIIAFAELQEPKKMLLSFAIIARKRFPTMLCSSGSSISGSGTNTAEYRLSERWPEAHAKAWVFLLL